MKFLSTLSLISAMLYLYVGIYTYRLNKKEKAYKIFLYFTIAMAIWAFMYSFAYTAENIFQFYFWNKLSAIGWCSFSALILYLVLNITENRFVKFTIIKFLVFLPTPIFLFMSIFLFGPNVNTDPNIATFFYTGDFIYNSSYLLLSIMIICFWGKNSSNINNKIQAKIIAISSILPFLLNLITQSILPMLGINSVPKLGQIYSLIMLAGVYSAIVNHGFIQIPSSLIESELFTEIMDLTFVLDLNYKIIKVNKHIYDLLKYSEKELIDLPIINVLKEKTLLVAFEKCMKTRETIHIQEINIPTKLGYSIPFSLSLTPLIDPKTNLILGILIVGQNMQMVKDLKYEFENHKLTSNKLKNSEDFFKTMVEMLPFSIVLTKTSDDTILYINSKTEKLFNSKNDEVVGELVSNYYYDPKERGTLIENIKQGGYLEEKEILLKRKDNSTILALITMVSAFYKDQEVLLTCFSDITEQKKLQKDIIKSEEMLKKLMYAIPDMVFVTDLEGAIVFVNSSAYATLGYDSRDNLLSRNILEFISQTDLSNAKINIKRRLSENLGPLEYIYLHKEGTPINVETNGTVLYDENNKAFGIVYVARDVTERKKAELSLKQTNDEIEQINNELLKANIILKEKSIRDSLTNLYNHQHINELLEVQISEVTIHKDPLCLMMLDIDFFKNVNDTFGHQVGDNVLVTLSDLIKLNVRDMDLVGRYGGEEFIIVLPKIIYSEAYIIADKIRLAVQNYKFDISALKITISIGITQFDSEDGKTLINRTDTLLYSAKENGRNRIN